MIDTLTDESHQVFPRQVFITPAQHQHDWLIKRTDRCYAAFRRGRGRVVVPAHAAQFTDQLQAMRHAMKIFNSFQHCIQRKPSSVADCKCSQRIDTFWSPRKKIFSRKINGMYALPSRKLSKPSCKYVPFEPLSKSLKLKVSNLPCTLSRKFHAQLSSCPRIATSSFD